MLSFEVLHVEIAQILQILNISLIFSNFSVDFQFLLIFCEVIENILKKGLNKLELMPSFKGT